MTIAVLTGDLVGSTKLSDTARAESFAALDAAARQISSWQAHDACLTRTRGDGWQLILTDTSLMLRAVVLIAASLRALGKAHATRIAIGTGSEPPPDVTDLNLADSGAFVRSGRLLDTQDTLFAATGADALTAVLPLLEHIVTGWTTAQARTVAAVAVRPTPTHAQIAQSFDISRQAVDQSLKSAGWPAISQSLHTLEAQGDSPASPHPQAAPLAKDTAQ